MSAAVLGEARARLFVIGSLMAVALVVAIVWMSSAKDDVSERQVPLSTSSWRPEPGYLRLDALVAGELRATSSGCLHLMRADGSPMDVVWPAGYAATKRSDGLYVVRNPAGAEVARTGESFESSGGIYKPGDALEANLSPQVVCRASEGKEFAVVTDTLP